jgi:hypothetical protein
MLTCTSQGQSDADEIGFGCGAQRNDRSDNPCVDRRRSLRLFVCPGVAALGKAVRVRLGKGS